MPAQIHEWCGQLHDPAKRRPCPCRANHTSRAEVNRRHRDAVQRARAGAPVDPAGKGWAA